MLMNWPRQVWIGIRDGQGLAMAVLSTAVLGPVSADSVDTTPASAEVKQSPTVADALDVLAKGAQFEWATPTDPATARQMSRDVSAALRVVYKDNATLAVPDIKAIAERAADTVYRTTAEFAYDILYRFGEPESYFLEEIEQWQLFPRRAAYCMSMLARVPNPERLPKWKAMRARALELRLGSAISMAVNDAVAVTSEAERVSALAKIDQRALRLAWVVLEIWNTGQGIPRFGRAGEGEALTYWARRELIALSNQHPMEVAAGLARETELATRLDREKYMASADWSSQMFYLVSPLGAACRAEWERQTGRVIPLKSLAACEQQGPSRR